MATLCLRGRWDKQYMPTFTTGVDVVLAEKTYLDILVDHRAYLNILCKVMTSTIQLQPNRSSTPCFVENYSKLIVIINFADVILYRSRKRYVRNLYTTSNQYDGDKVFKNTSNQDLF